MLNLLVLLLAQNLSWAHAPEWQALDRCAKQLGFAKPSNSSFHQDIDDVLVAYEAGDLLIGFNNGMGFLLTAAEIKAYGKEISQEKNYYYEYLVNVATPGVTVVSDVKNSSGTKFKQRSCVLLRAIVDKYGGIVSEKVLRGYYDDSQGNCELPYLITKPLQSNLLLATVFRYFGYDVKFTYGYYHLTGIYSCKYYDDGAVRSLTIRYPLTVNFSKAQDLWLSINAELKDCNREILEPTSAVAAQLCSDVPRLQKNLAELINTRVILTQPTCNSPQLPKSILKWIDETEREMFRIQKNVEQNLAWLKAACQKADPEPFCLIQGRWCGVVKGK